MTNINAQQMEQQMEQQVNDEAQAAANKWYDELIALVEKNTADAIAAVKAAQSEEELNDILNEYITGQKSVLEELLTTNDLNATSPDTNVYEQLDAALAEDLKAPKVRKCDIVKEAIKSFASKAKAKWNAMPTNDKLMATGIAAYGIGLLVFRNKMNQKALAKIGYAAMGSAGIQSLMVSAGIIVDADDEEIE